MFRFPDSCKNILMMKSLFPVLVVLIASFLFSSCEDAPEHPDVSNIQVDFKIRRIDKELRNCKTEADVLALLDKDPKFSTFFFERGRVPDSLIVRQILEFTNYEFSDSLFMDTERVYGDFSALEAEFKKAFQYISYYYPSFKAPDLQLVVSGFGSHGWGTDLALHKDYIVIGLDYFGGPSFTYRPQAEQVPGYMLRRYDKKHMLTTVLLRISKLFNRDFPPKGAMTAPDETMIADMISYGKSYYFMSQMAPFKADSLIIGYKEEDMVNIFRNQEHIYGHFLDNKLFFEKSDRLKNTYLGEAPRVSAIADKCPGRIGRWLGWQIIEHYMYENDEVTLQELMSNWKLQEIFQKSRYKPAPKPQS